MNITPKPNLLVLYENKSLHVFNRSVGIYNLIKRYLNILLILFLQNFYKKSEKYTIP